MLKIRDDVKLKELEKFGFEYEEEDGEKRNNKSGFIRFSNISNRNFNCTFNR